MGTKVARFEEFEDFEVVVVGAGPAGLASGLTLGAYGVETLVVCAHRETRLYAEAIALVAVVVLEEGDGVLGTRILVRPRYTSAKKLANFYSLTCR